MFIPRICWLYGIYLFRFVTTLWKLYVDITCRKGKSLNSHENWGVFERCETLFIRYCKYKLLYKVNTDRRKCRTNCIYIHVHEMTLHNAGSSTGFNITLKREGEKRIKKKRKRNYHNRGYSYLVTHPSTNPAKQGLTLLSRQDMVLSLWYWQSWKTIAHVTNSCGKTGKYITKMAEFLKTWIAPREFSSDKS